MPALILRSSLFGLLGMILVPVIAFAGVLALAHASGGCGPGNAGGCEMGAASLAMALAMPGFAVFFFVTLVRGLLRRKAPASPPPPSARR